MCRYNIRLYASGPNMILPENQSACFRMQSNQSVHFRLSYHVNACQKQHPGTVKSTANRHIPDKKDDRISLSNICVCICRIMA